MEPIFRLGNRIRSNPAENRFRRVDISLYKRVQNGIIDLPREQVISRALGFKYLDRETCLPSREVTRDNDYETRLLSFWGLNTLRIELDVDRWKGENHGTITVNNLNLGAMIINCKDSLLESEDGYATWEGYHLKNNFWPLFAPQFDDSFLKVQGLYINPFGTLEIKFEDLLRINRNTLINSAVLFGIVNNLDYIDFRDNRDAFVFEQKLF